MKYQFECMEHGLFEVNQPMLAEHTAECPVCRAKAQRKYSVLQWLWANTAFRPDGSYRQDKDYACLKG